MEVTTTVMMFQQRRRDERLKRIYFTLPEAATAAVTASTPRAVHLRCARETLTTDTESDALPGDLTPTEFAHYQRALTKGELLRPDGTEPTEVEWLAKLNSRRSRLRGTREVVMLSGVKETRVGWPPRWARA